MRDQALDRPRRGIAERADGVALDLLGDLKQHVDLALVRAALGHAAENPPHPPRSLAARGALATALMLVEIGDARNRPDQVVRLVLDNDGGGSETGAQLAKAVEIHRRVDDLLGRHHAHRGATRDDGLQIIPATPDAAAVTLDQLPERKPQRLLDITGTLDMAGDAEQLGADIVGAADAGEPGGTAAQDVRRDRDRLNVVDRSRAAVEADIGGERRLQPRLTL